MKRTTEQHFRRRGTQYDAQEEQGFVLLQTARNERKKVYARTVLLAGLSVAALILGVFLKTGSPAGTMFLLVPGALGISIVTARCYNGLAELTRSVRRDKHRARIRSRRRARNEEERERKQGLFQLKIKTTERQAELHTEKQRLEGEAARAKALLRHERNLRIDASVDRLLGLSLADLTLQMESAFARKGLRLKPAGEGDHLLVSDDNKVRAVARVLANENIASDADIEQLHALRVERDAPDAYFVVMRGFPANVVQQGAKYSITLVEAHLLAHWIETTAESTTRE